MVGNVALSLHHSISFSCVWCIPIQPFVDYQQGGLCVVVIVNSLHISVLRERAIFSHIYPSILTQEHMLQKTSACLHGQFSQTWQPPPVQTSRSVWADLVKQRWPPLYSQRGRYIGALPVSQSGIVNWTCWTIPNQIATTVTCPVQSCFVFNLDLYGIEES